LTNKITKTLRIEFTDDETHLYNVDGSSVEDIDLNISLEANDLDDDVFDLFFKYKLADKINIILDDMGYLIGIFCPNHTYIIDITNECFYINITLTAFLASRITERIKEIWPNFLFRTVCFMTPSGLKFDSKAQDAFDMQMDNDELLLEDFHFIEGQC